MSLNPGARIGSYEITGKLGEGGMGEVYRARDTRLNRDVAIKILPEAFASDPERLARFTREAQTLASLNHPNIAAIYGIESDAIVMELVDGEDLSTLIAASAAGSKDPGLQINHVLKIAHQIIDALEAAHDLGIVHRDLKPANIKVRDDGSVKVLDFGLAKNVEADGSTSNTANSPTLTARATQMGVILGTASYMSPEQARGRAVDKRTDVWAFGCVLYELVSGRKAFDGEDATEIISSVVKTEPDWNALPSSVPAHVRTVITRCLIKDRKGRLPDLSVVRYWLDEKNAATTAAAPLAASPASSRPWQIAATILLLTTLGAGAAFYFRSPAALAVTKFHIAPPDGTSFTAGSRAGAVTAAISPDGRTVAFSAQDASGKRLLYLRPVDSLTAQPLPGTEGGGYPFWSPDSRFIAYSVTNELRKVSAAGGPVQKLCTLLPGIFSRGGSWSKNDVLIFNNGPAPAPLYRVSAAGGEATKLGSLQQGETGRQFPWFLPDGRHFLYHATASSEQMHGIWVGSLDGSTPTRVLPSTTGAIYDQRTGRLLFLQQGTLMAQPFDLSTFKLSGEPVPIGERVEAAVVPGIVAFSISNTGVLAFGNGDTTSAQVQMTWVDRKGTAIGTVGPPAIYRGLSLSPDGLQIAAHRHETDGGDIWVTDVGRNSTTRLTFDAAQENSSPVWSPGSDRVAYSSLRNGKPGIYVKRADGTGQEEQLFEGLSVSAPLPFSWSPNGNTLLFMMPGAKTAQDLWSVSLSADHKATPVLETPFAENHGQISPDGKWLAYSSTETGTPEIYVRPMSTDGKWNVSNGVGNAPRWRGDSRELYYFAGSRITAVEITPKGTGISPGTPTPLFDYAGQANLGHSSLYSYAVSSDGKRFLISGARASNAGTNLQPIVVVTNWDEAFRKK